MCIAKLSFSCSALTDSSGHHGGATDHGASHVQHGPEGGGAGRGGFPGSGRQRRDHPRPR